MKIEYNIEQEDFIDFQLFTASKSERIRKNKNRGWIIMLILFAFLGINFYNSGNSTLAIYFGIVAIIVLLFYGKYFKWKLKNHYKKFVVENYSKRFGQLESLEINSDHIFAKDKTGEGKINISEIENVSETQNHFFIKITTGVSLIIPKTKIKNSQEIKSKFENLKIPIIDETNWKWN